MCQALHRLQFTAVQSMKPMTALLLRCFDGIAGGEAAGGLKGGQQQPQLH
jgi:hypothetical protein